MEVLKLVMLDDGTTFDVYLDFRSGNKYDLQ